MFDDKLMALEQRAWKERQAIRVQLRALDESLDHAGRDALHPKFVAADSKWSTLYNQLVCHNEAKWRVFTAWLESLKTPPPVVFAPCYGKPTKRRARTPRFDPIAEGIDELLEERRGRRGLNGKYVTRDLRVRS
jgi:hypothetical protein